MLLHTSREYEKELQSLRANLVEMAKLVEQMLDGTIAAIEQGDVNKANHIRAYQQEINEREKSIDKQCLVLLAKRQPMGEDLRFVAMVLKTVTDMERLGNLAINMCGRVVKQQDAPHARLPGDIRVMGQMVRHMLHSIVFACMHNQHEEAQKVIQLDDDLDELFHQTSRHILQSMSNNASSVETLLYWQSIAKWLERMGDHCANMAEQIVFLLKVRATHDAASVYPPLAVKVPNPA